MISLEQYSQNLSMNLCLKYLSMFALGEPSLNNIGCFFPVPKIFPVSFYFDLLYILYTLFFLEIETCDTSLIDLAGLYNIRQTFVVNPFLRLSKQWLSLARRTS